MTPAPEWVDLGLPSGLLWRSTNLNSPAPAYQGKYFSWGNTDGHIPGDGYDFTQEDYDESSGASIVTDLTLAEDAANVALGGTCRIPTVADFNELLANCTNAWTVINGQYGQLLTSNINGKTLFFPATGSIKDGAHNYINTNGFFWSSQIGAAGRAKYVSFGAADFSTDHEASRSLGFQIRPVKSV